MLRQRLLREGSLQGPALPANPLRHPSYRPISATTRMSKQYGMSISKPELKYSRNHGRMEGHMADYPWEFPQPMPKRNR